MHKPRSSIMDQISETFLRHSSNLDTEDVCGFSVGETKLNEDKSWFVQENSSYLGLSYYNNVSQQSMKNEFSEHFPTSTVIAYNKAFGSPGIKKEITDDELELQENVFIQNYGSNTVSFTSAQDIKKEFEETESKEGDNDVTCSDDFDLKLNTTKDLIEDNDGKAAPNGVKTEFDEKFEEAGDKILKGEDKTIKEELFSDEVMLKDEFIKVEHGLENSSNLLKSELSEEPGHAEEESFSTKYPTRDKCYKCYICDKLYSGRSSLARHIRIHTGEKPFKCAFCDMKFNQSGALKNHRLTHTGEKPFKCAFCDMRFKQSGALKNHRLTHTGEKPFKCDICDMRFNQSGALKNHRLTHTGEKPFKCDICNMRFNRKDSLKCHRLTHTGEKPFKCAFCDMRFKQSGALKNHRLTHTGEKPFKCDICDMRFNRRDVLKIHRQTHTAIHTQTCGKPFKCLFCDFSFTYENSLIYHMQFHHPLSPRA